MFEILNEIKSAMWLDGLFKDLMRNIMSAISYVDAGSSTGTDIHDIAKVAVVGRSLV